MLNYPCKYVLEVKSTRDAVKMKWGMCLLVDTIKFILVLDMYVVLNRNVSNSSSIWMTLCAVLLLPLLVSAVQFHDQDHLLKSLFAFSFLGMFVLRLLSSRMKQWLCLVLFLLQGEGNGHLKMCKWWKLGSQQCLLRNRFWIECVFDLLQTGLINLGLQLRLEPALVRSSHSERQRSLIWVLWEKGKC